MIAQAQVDEAYDQVADAMQHLNDVISDPQYQQAKLPGVSLKDYLNRLEDIIFSTTYLDVTIDLKNRGINL